MPGVHYAFTSFHLLHSVRIFFVISVKHLINYKLSPVAVVTAWKKQTENVKNATAVSATEIGMLAIKKFSY